MSTYSSIGFGEKTLPLNVTKRVHRPRRRTGKEICAVEFLYIETKVKLQKSSDVISSLTISLSQWTTAGASATESREKGRSKNNPHTSPRL